MSEYKCFKLLAEYNQWMNIKLYDVCSRLPEEELRLDRKAFFGSIYMTLNHIMYGDLAFLSRFTGNPVQVPSLGQELVSSFTALRAQRETLDIRIIDWVSALDPIWLDEEQTYKSKVDGKIHTVPRWALVTHMFNHQTHHRGQVTTLLSQMGLNIGSTDIPFMPQFIAA
ncbi:MAG: damage-inducible protein DinB [Stigonema ocellatum SAG 48.90 = DSM 106950]|nr:damage-inducible protein DinB [Stigonema ocellatum SAG 48.90 = DSM 106950]